MGYKSNRITLGHIKNRREYLEQTPYCECCGSHYQLAVHHHIPQQWKHLGQEYVLDIDCNYSTLCRNCHSIIEHNKSQYNRQLFGKMFGTRLNWMHYDYWHTLKNGKDPEYYVERKDLLYESI